MSSKTQKPKVRATARVVKSVVDKVLSSKVPSGTKTKRRTRSRTNKSPNANIISNYIATQNDPFDSPPVKLGYGSIGSTSLISLVVHQSVAATSTTSVHFQFWPFCDVNGAVGRYSTTAASSTPSWSYFTPVNGGGKFSFGNTARVVSGGVRVLPLIGSTADPGTVSGNIYNGISYAQMDAFTADSQIAAVGAHTTASTFGMTGHFFPISEQATEFKLETLLGATTYIPTHNTIDITFKGIADTKLILLEYILNLEVLNSGLAATTLSLAGVAIPESAVSDVFPTARALYKHVFPQLDPPIEASFSERGKRFVSKNRATAATSSYSHMLNTPHVPLSSAFDDMNRLQDKENIRPVRSDSDTIHVGVNPDGSTFDIPTPTVRHLATTTLLGLGAAGLYHGVNHLAGRVGEVIEQDMMRGARR